MTPVTKPTNRLVPKYPVSKREPIPINYWDIVEAALTSLPDNSPHREQALRAFDHLKARVLSKETALTCLASHAEEIRAATPKPRVTWDQDWLMWAVVCPSCGPLPAYTEREDAEYEAEQHRCEEPE